MKNEVVRMCAVCRKKLEKNNLLRIVKDKNGTISIDFGGKMAGRGAYICNDIACVEKCKKTKALNRAFKQEVDNEIYDEIMRQYEHREQ